ncbi:hypothetical protein ABT095_29665 [Kitasatospora sp. NPDC002227]|uniref:hypothetical protein n=1 Tax=Kitasatospora sp. NPDC002227 TaxID=3154773 RepID=UPI0033318BE2
MGFTGSFFVARSARPLVELPAVVAADGEPYAWWRDGEWQMLQVWPMGDPGDSIVRDTGAPVLAAHVMDGDFAAVEARSPGGMSWKCALRPQSAREYDFPEEWIGDPREVAEVAAAWAREAGRKPDPEAVVGVLTSDTWPAEGLVPTLLCALGFEFTEKIYLAEAGE